jgi:hypothetical protein
LLPSFKARSNLFITQAGCSVKPIDTIVAGKPHKAFAIFKYMIHHPLAKAIFGGEVFEI